MENACNGEIHASIFFLNIQIEVQHDIEEDLYLKIIEGE